jgi:hypothetical protein
MVIGSCNILTTIGVQGCGSSGVAGLKNPSPSLQPLIMNKLSIRFAGPEDGPVIFELVQALASYERLTLVDCQGRPPGVALRLWSALLPEDPLHQADRP